MPIESTIELFHLVSLYLYQQWRKEEVVDGGGGGMKVGSPIHLRAENIFIAVCSVALANSIMTVDARE